MLLYQASQSMFLVKLKQILKEISYISRASADTY